MSGSQTTCSATRQRGFTLIEMIVVIVITGILAGVLSRFLSEPVRGYLQVASRAVLVDQADISLRRIASEVQRALPNSLRVACGGQCLEFLSSVDGGVYRAQVSGINPADDILDFTNPAGDNGFDVLGGLRNAPSAGDQVVVYNLSASPTPPSSAYAGDNRATLAASTINRIVLSAPIQFPQPSAQQRFYLVDTPISYLCNPGAGELRRNANYPISAAQPTNTAQGVLLSDRVTACNFAFNPGTATRGGLLSMSLTLADGDERITVLHQVHVFNAP